MLVFAVPLARVVLTVFFGLLAFELAQDLLWPDLPKWKSHAIEVVYAAILASVAGYFALRLHDVLYRHVLEENEERKKSEEELRRNKEWFRALTENSSDLVTVIDPQGAVLYDSPSLERILGYRPIDRLGKSGFDLVHPEDIQSAKSVIARAFQHLGSTHTVEMRVRGQDGRWHVFESMGKAVMDHEGKLCGVINSRDITERKQIEEKLLLQTTALEAAVSGIVITNRDGAIVWVNPAFTKLTGYAAEEALGQNPRLLKSGIQGPDFYADLWSTITSGRSWHSEIVNKRKDGTLYTEEQTITPVRDMRGEITHFIAIKRDITERKQLEMQTRQLSRLAAVGQLIGGLAHELKNPLFILTGWIQMAREKLAHEEYATLGSDLAKIDEAGNRMKSIAERFMAIAKPVPPQQERCSIQAILNKALESLASELMQNKIWLSTDFSTELPEVHSDPRQLYEVFLGLLLNAIQAMARSHGKGTLTVSTTVKDNWIEVRIQDDGPGISPEHRARLFEPFFTTSGPGQGAGLGLWIVRSTLMMLKGEVHCESEAGQGATFAVRLPVTCG